MTRSMLVIACFQMVAQASVWNSIKEFSLGASPSQDEKG